jgi:hypothetical protein
MIVLAPVLAQHPVTVSRALLVGAGGLVLEDALAAVAQSNTDK